MAILFPRMFCSDVPNRDTLFALRAGQIIGRTSRVAHKADWYNSQGIWLGCGDLCADNIRQIAKYLSPPELFIVVDSQYDDYALPRPTSWRKSPAYLGRECRIIVQSNQQYYVADHLAQRQRFYARGKCMFLVFDHRKARELIADANRQLAQEAQPTRLQA